MLHQLLLGFTITFVSLVGATLVWWVLTETIMRLGPWMHESPKPPKALFSIFIVVLSTMGIMSFGISLWAILFMENEIFATWEEAVYYALVAYTTLGLGDVAVPIHQRLLGGLIGANGFLMFGMMTAMLTDTLRLIRRMQND